MRTTTWILALVVALGCAGGMALWAVLGTAPAGGAGEIPLAALSSGGGLAERALPTESMDLRERVDELELELAQLRGELERLRSLARSAAVEAPAEESPVPAAVAARTGTIDPVAFAAAFEAYDEQRKATRAAEREAAEIQRVLEKAEAISRELVLLPGEEKALGDILLEERRRQAALAEEVKARGRSKVTREWAAAEKQALASWKAGELAARLNPEAARKLIEPPRSVAKRAEGQPKGKGKGKARAK